jgi:hypothetical protein
METRRYFARVVDTQIFSQLDKEFKTIVGTRIQNNTEKLNQKVGRWAKNIGETELGHWK